jgi:hypothetical protein
MMQRSIMDGLFAQCWRMMSDPGRVPKAVLRKEKAPGLAGRALEQA